MSPTITTSRTMYISQIIMNPKYCTRSYLDKIAIFVFIMAGNALMFWDDIIDSVAAMK